MRRHLHRAILGGLLGATFLAGFPAEAAVVVSTKPTAHMSCVAEICTATAANAVLNVTDLDNLLASGSATVSTGGATASDIDIAAALTWASGNSLTLDAYRSLIVTHPVAASGSGGLTILTNDGGTGGVLSFQGAGHIGFLGLTNALSINGASYKLEGDIASLASDIAANASGNYALAASYNASSDGVYSTSPISTWFTGNFEGLGNSITHLKINDNGDENVGLFAVVAGGHVSDINIVNAQIEASSSAPSSVGILVGTLIGAVNGTTKGSGVGGTISGAVTSGTVQVKSGTQADAGGLVGQIGSYGAGYQTALVVNSQTSATVTTNVGYAGGLLGEDDGTSAVVTSFATGQVTAKDGFAGGLVGFDGGSVLNSYATGNATIGPAAHFKPKCSVGGTPGNKRRDILHGCAIFLFDGNGDRRHGRVCRRVLWKWRRHQHEQLLGHHHQRQHGRLWRFQRPGCCDRPHHEPIPVKPPQRLQFQRLERGFHHQRRPALSVRQSACSVRRIDETVFDSRSPCLRPEWHEHRHVSAIPPLRSSNR